MKYILILLLLVNCLNAQTLDSNVNKAGVKFTISKSFELAAFGITTAGIFAKYPDNAKNLFLFAGVCQVASITYFYKGCQLLIKANGITIKF